VYIIYGLNYCLNRNLSFRLGQCAMKYSEILRFADLRLKNTVRLLELRPVYTGDFRCDFSCDFLLLEDVKE
jgi:hypothetical protein